RGKHHKSCTLRVSQYSEAPNGRNRRNVLANFSSKFFGERDRSFKIRNLNMGHPAWPTTHLGRFCRDRHYAAHRTLMTDPHPVSLIAEGLCFPAKYFTVEENRRVRIRGQKFVPNKSSVGRIYRSSSHAFISFSYRALKEPVRYRD